MLRKLKIASSRTVNYKWELRDYDTPLLVDGFGRAQEAQFKAKVAQVKELARNLKPSESIKFTISEYSRYWTLTSCP